MKANLIVKVLAGLLVVIALFVIKATQNDEKESELSDSQLDNTGSLEMDVDGLSSTSMLPTDDNGLDVEEDQFESEHVENVLGVDFDTPVETMKTLTQELKAVRKNSEKLQKENKDLKHQTNELLRMKESIEAQLNSQFDAVKAENTRELKKLNNEKLATQSLLENVSSRLNKLTMNKEDDYGQENVNGYDINSRDNGIPTGLGYDREGKQVDFDEMIWIDPLDSEYDKKTNKLKLPKFNNKVESKALQAAESVIKKVDEDIGLIKRYTIPVDATLLDSVSMTALLGRVPIDGQVVDPYPFKILIGEENLSSNGIDIPDLVGIKMSGIAKGDWLFSCVSGQIFSMTFTFKDGTITTVPKSGTSATEPIAWFSDIYGVPCIAGKRITNAPSFLGQRVFLSAASAYHEAKADAEYSTDRNLLGTTTKTLTGDSLRAAKNASVSSGLSEVKDWSQQRMANSYDAIYVPPGAKLNVHVTQELQIDYDPNGRKVRHYENENNYSFRNLD